MSVLLQAREVGHSVAGRALFADLELVVNRGDRLGLVGHNGSGKTTLLDLLWGSVSAESGTIQRRRGLRMARVEQFLSEDLSDTAIVDAVAACAAEEHRWRAQALLEEFGFASGEHSQPVNTLSGGQQNRLMFARALMSEPELLLLDEPTNHLDLATLVLFEAVLRGFGGAFLLVSHDRAFLDAVTDQTLFLRDGHLHRFALSYSEARLELEEQDDAAVRARRAEDAQIDRLRRSAKRLAEWGRTYDNEKFARRARNMERRVKRMESERTVVSAGSPLSLELELRETRSRQALAVDQLDVVAGGRRLFCIEELIVRPGERLALLGHNGVGKTTLIRALVAAAAAGPEAAADHPRIRFSPQTVLGYYDQELAEVSGAETLMDFAVRRTERDEQTVRGSLIHAGFGFADHAKRVADLSGGERARLLFAVLSLNAPNLLIMDEPTNHIDIAGKEALESQLLESPATLLITSHDRHFLTTVATRFLWVHNGTLLEISDPDEFFASRPAVAGTPGDDRADAAPAPRPSHRMPALEEDRLLVRIVELEGLLGADRARKPKHQKPALQKAWQQELDALYRRLE